ncbi:MAG: sodium ion-translocating decarboxylase subunit beta [Acutalibacteraceae bacterium]
MDILQGFIDSLVGLFLDSGLTTLVWQNYVMILISIVLLYLAIKKQYEPLLLLPIAFGMLLVNLFPAIMQAPMTDMIPKAEYLASHPGTIQYPITVLNGVEYVNYPTNGGLLWYLYQGVKLGIYPPLIFLGIGAMTDFGPLIANPKSFILGAAAQIGIFITFFGAIALGFSPEQAGSIGIIGGADGPTAIFVTSKLAPELLGPIAVAAYSYMALVPIIQPPIMKALTTKKERSVVMKQLRPVSKLEKIMFPVIVVILVAILLPDAAPLVGMLMLGNLFRESGVVDRIFKAAQNELMNIITIFLGVTVGATATGTVFLSVDTLKIIALGLAAFCVGTACGVLFGKLMYIFTKGKVNPLIGSAGVSAVPMAARVAQKVGQQENPANFLLMHAMGPNVAGVIGSAVAAGVLISVLG